MCTLFFPLKQNGISENLDEMFIFIILKPEEMMERTCRKNIKHRSQFKAIVFFFFIVPTEEIICLYVSALESNPQYQGSKDSTYPVGTTLIICIYSCTLYCC
uniref:Uncharacterized protein n=1 Tax=Cacopsylla melanoneura TaxID=428564 RepID=A0A8D8R5Y8_9HEMI